MGKKRLPILSVIQTGNPEFERFVIKDQKQRMWNGELLGQETTRPLLYAAHEAAACDIHNILKSNFQGVEPVRYVVPLVVEVFSHEAVHVAEVAQHLSRSSRLFLNSTEYGNGPRNSLVLPVIEWHRIEPMKEIPNESEQP